MFLRNALRIHWRKSMLLAVLVIAGTATAALAWNTWTVIIGTSGDDTINQSGKHGNYRIWGLAGNDTLTGGKGDNLIVGDGQCPPGAATDDSYCNIQEVQGDPGDTLRGGGGNNAIFAGGGPNKIYGGRGHNYIQAGSATNLIYGGPKNDVIIASKGSSTIYPGKGHNFIDAHGPGIEKIYCSGKRDWVFADANDVVENCAHVFISQLAKDSPALVRKGT